MKVFNNGIFKKEINNINISKPNYYQINSYIQLIGEQLSLFSDSVYLNTSILKDIKYRTTKKEFR